MTERKTPWTPGPWETGSREVSPQKTAHREVFAASFLVASCHSQRERDEQRANARLIAAAPEMAELLGRVCNHDFGIWGTVSATNFELWREQARALLARLNP